MVSQFSASAHQGATGIVKERMDKFSEAKRQMRQIGAALREDDMAQIATISAAMLQWATEMPDAFPEGSDKAPSEAAPAIWQDQKGFHSAIDRYHEALVTLNETALTNDSTATAAAISEVGASCKNCHRSYRQ